MVTYSDRHWDILAAIKDAEDNNEDATVNYIGRQTGLSHTTIIDHARTAIREGKLDFRTGKVNGQETKVYYLI